MSSLKSSCTPAEIAVKKRKAEELRRLNREKRKKEMASSENQPSVQVSARNSLVEPELTSEMKAQIEKKRLACLELAKKTKLISEEEAAALAAKKILPGKVPYKGSSFKDPAPSKTVPINRTHPYLKPQNRVEKGSNVPLASPAVLNTTANQNDQIASTSNSASSASSKKQELFIKHDTTVVKFEMITENRFAAKMEKKNDIVINEFKKISSHSYNQKLKEFNFSFTDYDELIKLLTDIEAVSFETIPQYSLKYIQRKTESVNDSCLELVEPVLVESLLPFQREGVLFGIARGGRFLLADEMGLGKTRQALAVADYYKKDWPMLIVTAASVRNVWYREILELLTSLSVHHVRIVESKNDIFFDAKVVITSYAMLDKENFDKNNFKTVIFDESHSLKNPKSVQTKNAKKLAYNATRVILLTGTPALSRPVELYSQILIIDKDFMKFISFTKRYCNGHSGQFGWDDKGSSHLRELNALLQKNFMIRRTKNDVYMELGIKKRLKVELKSIKRGEQTFAASYQGALGKKGEQREILLQWFVATGKLKQEAVCLNIEEQLKKTEEKILIFAVHHNMMDAISDVLTKNKIRHVRIDGTTKSETRASNVENFQRDPGIRVAVLSIGACSTGITLTSASTIIFAELDWTPANLLQCEARAHRIGQERQVTCYYLIAPGTADDVIWPMLQEKQRTLQQVGLVDSNEHLSQLPMTKFDTRAGPSTLAEKPKNSLITDFYTSSLSSSSDDFYSCKEAIDETLDVDDEILKAVEEAEKQDAVEKKTDYDDCDDFILNEDDLKGIQQLEDAIADKKIHDDLALFIDTQSFTQNKIS